MYDYVIIGGGPTGITMAWYLSKLNKKVIILEKEMSLGGCHRVKRQESYFSEHGPRIYMNNSNTFKAMLRDMNIDFNKIFTPYKFNLVSIGGGSIKYFTMREILLLVMHFLIINNQQKKVTLKEFLSKNRFTKSAIWYIDRLARLTDGGGIDRTTVYQFLQLVNQNGLYSAQQPILPNDKLLFKMINKQLIKNRVDVMFNCKILNIIKDKNHIFKLMTNHSIIEGKKYILCMPPKSISNFIINTPLRDAFSHKFYEWAHKTDYDPYISLTFHWNKNLKLKPIWGFPKTDWGIAFIVLSDYMKFNESKTVISAAVTVFDKSRFINKTPHECDKNELLKEVFRQIKISYPNLLKPSFITFNQNDKVNNKWVNLDTAFLSTINGYIPFTTFYKNLFNCGTHNGHSNYIFTSIESATQNAINLVNRLEGQEIKIYSRITIRFLLSIILMIIIIIYGFKNYKFTKRHLNFFVKIFKN
jgi:hypothetical protein